MDRLRPQERSDAPSVDRALAWLVRRGRTRVACRPRPEPCADPARAASALFNSCGRCRPVSAIEDPEPGRSIGRRATTAMFKPWIGTSEILGVCRRFWDRGVAEVRRDGAAVDAGHDHTPAGAAA